MTMPSSLLKVAFVGQTDTQGGFSQWLHRVRTCRPLRSPIYASSSGKSDSKGEFNIHLISLLQSGISGMLWTRRQALMHVVHPSFFVHPNTETAMAHCFRAFSDSPVFAPAAFKI